MTAIVLMPLLLGAGVAIDVARVVDYKAKLRSAADAAVLAAIAEGSPAKSYALSMAGTGKIPPGNKDAKAFFKANLLDLKSVSLKSVKANVRKQENRIFSNLEYEAEVPITFAGVLNVGMVTLSGHAEAEIKTGAAVDFYVLLDNSPSMGVGATMDDINRMVANTSDSCAFACHELNNANNYYNLAKSLGIAMRIDVVRQATQKLTETAEANRQYSSQFRMAVYSFGKKAEDRKLTRIAKLSADMNEVRKSAAALDLMTTPTQNYDGDQLTGFDDVFDNLDKEISTPGNGLGGSDPQKVVFFVSDGVGDSYKPVGCTKKTTSGRCQEPIDIKACNELKARDIKIAVLYTTYLPLPDNAWYNDWIKPFQSEIATRMRDCATPGLYFEVSPSEGIPQAMDALFLKTLSLLRLIA